MLAALDRLRTLVSTHEMLQEPLRPPKTCQAPAAGQSPPVCADKISLISPVPADHPIVFIERDKRLRMR